MNLRKIFNIRHNVVTPEEVYVCVCCSILCTKVKVCTKKERVERKREWKEGNFIFRQSFRSHHSTHWMSIDVLLTV